MKKYFLLLVLISFLLPVGLRAQASPTLKDRYRAGKNSLHDSDYVQAIIELNEARKYFPLSEQGKISEGDVTYGLGECYFNLGKLDSAKFFLEKAKDLRNDKNEKNILNRLIQVYFSLNEFAKADTLLAALINIPKTSWVDKNKYLLDRAYANIFLHHYALSMDYCHSANQLDAGNHRTYFLIAVALDSLNNKECLPKYGMAIQLLSNSEAWIYNKMPHKDYFHYWTAYLKAAVKFNECDRATIVCNEAIVIDSENPEIYVDLAKCYEKINNDSAALIQLDIALDKKPGMAMALMCRGELLFNKNEFNKALQDFNQILQTDSADSKAYRLRGICYLSLENISEAQKDFQQAKKLNPTDTSISRYLTVIENKRFETNKESNPPIIALTSPEVTPDSCIQIKYLVNQITLHGRIQDQSKIKSIYINNSLVSDSIRLNPEFTFTLPLISLDQISIKATDVYDNSAIIKYRIKKPEPSKCLINIDTPPNNTSNEIYPEEPYAEKIELNFTINNESGINSVLLNGNQIRVEKNEDGVEYSGNVSIENTDTLFLTITDNNNYQSVYKYYINRERSEKAKNNPMGRTWVVFIENSNYKQEQLLDGPKKDYKKIRNALRSYEIDTIIHKVDLTRLEMEYFFQDTLPTLIEKANVNSVMIWYAGHGSKKKALGFWVPIDGTTKNLTTCFPLRNLQICLRNYAAKHLLVISDACETAPGFYDLKRGATDYVKSCSDFQHKNLKSVQGITSSGIESTNDKSEFANLFSAELSKNNGDCITINKIFENIRGGFNEDTGIPSFETIDNFHVDAKATFIFIKKNGK